MNLQEFLTEIGGKESNIICYSQSEALEAVKQNGYALWYVNKSVFTKVVECQVKN